MHTYVTLKLTTRFLVYHCSFHTGCSGPYAGTGEISYRNDSSPKRAALTKTGGSERCRWVVEELEIDDCVDYTADEPPARLQRAFPEGIDVFSEGVGGRVTTAAVHLMDTHGRMLSFSAAAAL